MAKNYLIGDLRAVLRGLESVATSTVQQQQQQCLKKWELSSVKTVLDETGACFGNQVRNFNKDEVLKKVKEGYERTSMVYYGVREFAAQSAFLKLVSLEFGVGSGFSCGQTGCAENACWDFAGGLENLGVGERG